MKRRLLQWALNTLIAALLVSLAALTYITWAAGVQTSDNAGLRWLGQLFGRETSAGTRPFVELPSTRSYNAAAEPVCVIYSVDGARTGARLADDAVYSLYYQSHYSLREAMSMASEAVLISQEEYRRRLDNSVLFIYPAPLPLSLLNSWLSNREQKTPITASRTVAMTLADDGTVTLVWHGDGLYYRADTATPYRPGAVSGMAACRLSFDGEEMPGLAEDYVLFDDPPAPRQWQVRLSNDWERWGQALLAPLGINAETARVIVGTDNSRVRYDEERHLKVTPDGTAEFHAPESAGSADELGLAELVERSRQIVTAGAPYWGEGRVMLVGVETEGTRVTLTYEYILSGLRLQPDAEALAGVFTFTGGRLTYARLRLRHCLRRDEITLIPESTALTLLASLYPGRVLALCYLADADGLMTPEWTVAP